MSAQSAQKVLQNERLSGVVIGIELSRNNFSFRNNSIPKL